MKKIYWILTLIGILCMGMSIPHYASAATVSDSSSDNTIATANAINMGDTVKGSITKTDDLDYYKFTLSSAGCITLNMTSYMQYYCIKIFDSDGKQIWYTDYNEWTASVGYHQDTYNLYFESGTYYMQINGYKYSTYSKSTGTYECKTSFVSSGVNNVESDNSYAAANHIILGNTIIGQISENDNYDTYKYELSGAGCVTLNMTSYMKYYCIKIFNSDGKEIWYTEYNEWTASVGYRRDTYNLYLEKGTYYMQINGYRYGTSSKSTGKYVVGTAFKLSDVSFDNDDNSFAAAKSISWNTTYTGQISINDDFDTYKFVVTSGRKVPITITSYMQYYCIKIFDADGKQLWYTDYNKWNGNVSYRKDTYSDLTLSAGTYYMQINGYQYGTSNKSTGTYKFSIGTEAPAQTTTEKTVKTPAQTITKPAKVTGVSVTAKRKGLKIKWKKISGVSGYQICYSTSSKFNKKKTKLTTGTSLTLKKLKAKKRYYVKIRAYKVKNGKKVYGNYSKVVKKKTK